MSALGLVVYALLRGAAIWAGPLAALLGQEADYSASTFFLLLAWVSAGAPVTARRSGVTQ